MSMIKAGVIGYPIRHSKSPIIHNYWFKKNNIQGSYEAIEIEPQNLEKDIQTIIDQDFSGFNVTIPHKQLIIGLCDDIDETAKFIGAVNTVVIRNRELFGFNTDSYGFIQNIKQSQTNFIFKDKTAFVLGAGGAARAVIYGLLQEGVSEVIITNRTREKAEALVALNPSKIRVVDWQEREKSLNISDLVINTTSLGMAGQPALDLDLTSLNSSVLVTDIVYAPLMTPLLKQAQERGNSIVTGIGMLLHQARPAFEKWTGVLPDVDDRLVQQVLK
ncbi:MAG: shikimate dehydrogenase [Pseudomonadota bacterium]